MKYQMMQHNAYVANRTGSMWVTCLLHGEVSFLRSWPVFSQSTNSQHFMTPEGSLPHSQVPATCPYPEPAQSSPHPCIPLLKIHLNIIVPSMPGSPKWSLTLRFPHQNPVYTSLLPHTCYVPTHLILLDFITWTILSEKYRSLSSSLCSFLHSPVTSPLSGPNILLSTLFSNTLSLSSSLNISDHVLHQYKTTGKIKVLIS